MNEDNYEGISGCCSQCDAAIEAAEVEDNCE